MSALCPLWAGLRALCAKNLVNVRVKYPGEAPGSASSSASQAEVSRTRLSATGPLLGPVMEETLQETTARVAGLHVAEFRLLLIPFAGSLPQQPSFVEHLTAFFGRQCFDRFENGVTLGAHEGERGWWRPKSQAAFGGEASLPEGAGEDERQQEKFGRTHEVREG